jgi:transcriptional regulator with XRE-family HTH domain
LLALNTTKSLSVAGELGAYPAISSRKHRRPYSSKSMRCRYWRSGILGSQALSHHAEYREPGMTTDTPFGGLVKQRRIALGMSQAGLADLVGRSASAIRSWERGSSTPTDEAVIRSLGAVLGIEEGDLRSTVGMPAEVVPEDLEEIGGRGLRAFAEAGVQASDGPVDAPVLEPSDGEITNEAGERDAVVDGGDESVPVTDEISWDDVAASVASGSEPATPAGDGEVNEEEADRAEVGDVPEEVETPDVEDVLEASGSTPESTDEEIPGDNGDEPEGAEPEVDLRDPESDRGLLSVPSSGADRPRTEGPLVSTQPSATFVASASAAASRTAMMSVRETPSPPVVPSYLDDPDQMMTYWIRTALTVAFTMFLLVILFWALGNLGDSIGEVWDLFKAGA